jgi:hypothetical protein
MPIKPKQPSAIKDAGTCTYMILTESPCMKSGGENKRAYINPTKTNNSIKKIKKLKSLLLNERILFGKKFLSIQIYYIQNQIIRT